MSKTKPSDFSDHRATIRTNADTIVVRDYGNCTLMNKIFDSDMNIGNVGVTDDGHIKVNLSSF